MKISWLLKIKNLDFMIIATAIVILLITFTVARTGSSAQATKETIVFGDLGWDSAQVHNRIAAFILENGYGYEPDFAPGEAVSLYQALVRGDIDVKMEAWIKSQQEAYNKAMDTGQIVNLGTNFADNWQGWLVPTYVIEGDPSRGIEPVAPDLKSVFDLPRYWDLFKDPEVPEKGRFHSCPPGWECQRWNAMKIEAYGLDDYYNVFVPGSDASLAGSMVGAYERGNPWFGYYWEPTWIMGKLDMTKLEEPPYDEEIWNTTKACAWPSDPTAILVNISLSGKAPEAVELLSNYETDVNMNNAILAYMQGSEANASEAAVWFLRNYESVWTGWIPPDIAEKVKEALP